MIMKWFGKREFWSTPIKIIQGTKLRARTVAVGMGLNGVREELLLGKRQRETLRLVRENEKKNKRHSS